MKHPYHRPKTQYAGNDAGDFIFSKMGTNAEDMSIPPRLVSLYLCIVE